MSIDITPHYPSPEVAYEAAPSIISEISWVAHRAASASSDWPMSREFWLRKAATLDRIGLSEAETYTPEAAARANELAEKAAAKFADYDRAHYTTRGHHGPSWTGPAPSYRPYVRQEYAAWSAAEAQS